VFTDSLSLFDVITRSTKTSEKRLMIDIAAAKAAYKEGTLDTIGFIRTRFNPADVFTMIGRHVKHWNTYFSKEELTIQLSNGLREQFSSRLETTGPGVSGYSDHSLTRSIISR
jgi:hypothetical protein